MHMPISENPIRLQLITCLSSALTLVFFCSNTTDRSIQWLSQHVGRSKKKCRTWPHFVHEGVEGDRHMAESEQELCTKMWKKAPFKL